MNPIKQYKLYISTECKCCNKVLDYLYAKKIAVKTINIDTEEYELPFKLMVLPALVKENKLVGYGFNDISNHLDAA